MNTDTDLTHEFRRAHRARAHQHYLAHARKRMLARAGVSLAAGVALGSLVFLITSAPLPRAALILGLVLWAAWGLHFLTTRH